MKKLLIVNNNMHIGGVQKALVSLLWSIRHRYDITLLLFHPNGACMEELPPEIRVISPGSAFRYLGMTKQDVLPKKDRLGRSFFAAITRLLGRKYALWLMSLGQTTLKGYDAAISYLHDGGSKAFYGGCNDFVLKHVAAKRKLTFLHCDYLLCGANTPENGKKYAKFDGIAACSQGCADAFLQANPELKDRVRVVSNCHRFDRILSEASQPVSLTPDKINLVTVARLGREKSVERGLLALTQLGEEREKLHYHIIGDGVQRPLLEKIIGEEGLSSCVTLWGEMKNPYSHMQAADLLLIPSLSEAAPLVIGEAASLGTPILSTKTSSAEEMIEKTGYGWVCGNSVEGIARSLAELLRQPEQLRNARERLKKQPFDNSAATAQLEALLEF